MSSICSICGKDFNDGSEVNTATFSLNINNKKQKNMVFVICNDCLTDLESFFDEFEFSPENFI